MKEAVAYMHSHPAEVLAILGKKFPNLEPKLIAAAFDGNPQVDAEGAGMSPRRRWSNADDFNIEAG